MTQPTPRSRRALAGRLLLALLCASGLACPEAPEGPPATLPPAVSNPAGGGQLVPVDPPDPDRPYYANFGVLVFGEKRTQTFRYRNAGPGDVTVLRALGQCSCTRLTALRALSGDDVVNGDPRAKGALITVPEGALLELDIEVDSGKSTANLAKLAIMRVATSSLLDPYLTFELSFKGERLFEVTPASAKLGEVPESAGGATNVRVFHRRYDKPVRVLEILETSPGLTANLEPLSDGSLNFWNLVVRLEEGWRRGPYKGHVLLSTTDSDGVGDGGRLTVDVYGNVVDDIVLRPSTLSFSQVPASSPTDRAEIIGSLESLVPGRRIKVVSHETTGAFADRVAVDVRPLLPDSEGRSQHFDIGLRLIGDLPPGRMDGELVLTFDDEQLPSISRPLFALVR